MSFSSISFRSFVNFAKFFVRRMRTCHHIRQPSCIVALTIETFSVIIYFLICHYLLCFFYFLSSLYCIFFPSFFLFISFIFHLVSFVHFSLQFLIFLFFSVPYSFYFYHTFFYRSITTSVFYS